MADIQGQRITALTEDSTPTTGDKIIMDNATDGTKQIDYDTLANAILNKLTSKTYTLDAGTQTLIAALNALNSKMGDLTVKTLSLPANSTTNYTVAANARIMLFIVGASANAMCIYILSATSAKAITRNKIGTASEISDSVSTGKLTLTNSGSANLQLRCFVFLGDISA